jgi:hypothetical protein
VPAYRDALDTASGVLHEALRRSGKDVGRPGGPTVLEYVGLLAWSADLHAAGFRLDRSVAVLDEAMAWVRVTGTDRTGPAESAARAELLVRRGNVHRMAGRWPEAHRDLSDAVRAAQDDAGRLGAAINAAGVLCKDLGDLAGARARYAHARSLLGDDPAAQASVLHNLAGLAHAERRFADGEALIREALALRSRIGSPPRDVLADEGVLVALLVGLGRLQEAEVLVRTSIAQWSALAGADHYEVAHLRHHLAALLRRRGDDLAADVEYRRARRSLLPLLGPRHPDVVRLQHDLAGLPTPSPPTHSAEHDIEEKS